MADILDMAAKYEERDRQAALARRKEEAPKATGTCLNCGEEGIEGRWCPGGECRDEWEEEMRLQALRIENE